jgi:hypothetical protein
MSTETDDSVRSTGPATDGHIEDSGVGGQAEEGHIEDSGDAPPPSDDEPEGDDEAEGEE